MSTNNTTSADVLDRLKRDGTPEPAPSLDESLRRQRAQRHESPDDTRRRIHDDLSARIKPVTR